MVTKSSPNFPTLCEHFWERQSLACSLSTPSYPLSYIRTGLGPGTLEIKRPHSQCQGCHLCGNIIPCFRLNESSFSLLKACVTCGSWPTLLLHLQGGYGVPPSTNSTKGMHVDWMPCDGHRRDLLAMAYSHSLLDVMLLCLLSKMLHPVLDAFSVVTLRPRCSGQKGSESIPGIGAQNSDSQKTSEKAYYSGLEFGCGFQGTVLRLPCLVRLLLFSLELWSWSGVNLPGTRVPLGLLSA